MPAELKPRRDETESLVSSMMMDDPTGTPDDVRLFPASSKTTASIRIAQSHSDESQNHHRMADYREYLMAQRMQQNSTAPTKLVSSLIMPDQQTSLYDLHLLTGGSSARDRLHRDYQPSAWKHMMPRLNQDDEAVSVPKHGVVHALDEKAWNLDLALPLQDEEERELVVSFAAADNQGMATADGDADGVFELDM